MSRTPRYLPRPGALVEITQRTLQGRFLFRPSPRLNAIIVGCLARAQKSAAEQTGRAPKVHAVVFLSNHFHLLAAFDSVKQMTLFMCHLKTNLSKEVGRLHHWPGPMFAGRYRQIALSDEPMVHEQRLRYLLSQGTKEDLVLSPRDWPGVHCATALAQGEPLRGVWIDRAAWFRARQKDPEASEQDFTREETLVLEPLPCFEELDAPTRQQRIGDIIEEIEAAALHRHENEKTAPCGAQAVRRRKPHDRPAVLARSPMPRFHAASKRWRRKLYEGFQEFLIAYRAAAERLAAGDRTVTFPENCFPPGLPFSPPLRV